MTYRDALLQEFDLELPFTRRSVERVPDGKFSWKPHDKAMTIGWLATFIAMVPTWGVMTIERDEFEAGRIDGPKPALPTSSEQLLAIFDGNYATLRTSLAGTSDEHLMKPWTLKFNGEVWFTQPRWLTLREFIFNHIVHHRAQLGVFLRLLGQPVPAIYNESGDEAGGVFRDRARDGNVLP